MSIPARRAHREIQRCVASERYRLTRHFLQRMDERRMIWADVLAVIDKPDAVRADGHDDLGRDKWIIAGQAGDGLALELVAVLDVDKATGVRTVFITIYWSA